jgi:hypothetical protein
VWHERPIGRDPQRADLDRVGLRGRRIELNEERTEPSPGHAASTRAATGTSVPPSSTRTRRGSVTMPRLNGMALLTRPEGPFAPAPVWT